MAYQVVLAETAKADANQIYDWIVWKASVRGPNWFEELIDCLYSLEQFPYRCPLAREAAESRHAIRRLLFGSRNDVYRIFYEVEEARQTVWILHIRHEAPRDLTRQELGEPR